MSPRVHTLMVSVVVHLAQQGAVHLKLKWMEIHSQGGHNEGDSGLPQLFKVSKSNEFITVRTFSPHFTRDEVSGNKNNRERKEDVIFIPNSLPTLFSSTLSFVIHLVKHSSPPPPPLLQLQPSESVYSLLFSTHIHPHLVVGMKKGKVHIHTLAI